MYKYKNGEYTNDDHSVSKTVRLNPEDITIIESCTGRNFSDKLKRLIRDYQRQKERERAQDKIRKL